MALISTRAKWRSSLSACSSVRKKYLTPPALLERQYYDNLDDISLRKPKNALLALFIPHVQEVGIAGGGNIAVAFVNGTI